MNLAQMINEAGALGEQLSAWLMVALPNLVAAIAILLAGWWLAGRLERAVGALLDGQGRFDATLKAVLTKLARYVVLIVVLIAALSQLGIETTSIIAALGAVGLAIGLALQNTLSNIAAGVMLLWLRPFSLGDFIEAGDSSGTVEEIGLFATRLTTFEGIFVFVPNSELWNRKIINYTRGQRRMVRETFTIAYDDDIATGREALLELVKNDNRVHAEPAPVVNVSELGDSAVGLELRAWTDTPNYLAVRWDTLERGKMVLEASGLTIPFPQQDVHLKDLPETGINRLMPASQTSGTA